MNSNHSTAFQFSTDDLKKLKSRGLQKSDITEFLQKYQANSHFVKLLKPLEMGKGIQTLTGPDCEIYAEVYESFLQKGTVAKFVPGGSGSNNIFKQLSFLNNSYDQIDERMLTPGDPYTEKNMRWLIDFINQIEKFPFFSELESVLKTKNLGIKTLLSKGEYKEILKALLDSEGLNYSELPIGLLKIHTYPGIGAVTPIEEHIVQEVEYLLHANNQLKLHFTTTNEFYLLFRDHIEDIKTKYKLPGIDLKLETSIQDPKTDTLSVGLDNKPLRNEGGELAFRSGGHGSLLPNLNAIDSELIFIKGMPNVCHATNKQKSNYFQKVLGGYLLEIRKRIFFYINKLQTSPSPALYQEIDRYGESLFNWDLSHRESSLGGPNEQREYKALLDRPLRVCGLVPKQEFQGGGAFWISDKQRGSSVQIVEKWQVDFSKPEQAEIYQKAEYYNPVQMVCCFQNHKGELFNLEDFSNQDAYQINVKHFRGEPMKTLEYPGLWNGGMAGWNTVFVELPKDSYFPITHISDLLDRESF